MALVLDALGSTARYDGRVPFCNWTVQLSAMLGLSVCC